MISPTSVPALANLAVAAAGVATAGAGAAAKAVAAEKAPPAPVAARAAAAARRSTAASARRTAGANAPGALVRAAARTRIPAATVRRITVPGYATTTATNADVAFLRDPKLSLEDKLMRLLAHLNKKAEAEIQKKMEEVGGVSTPATSKKRKSVFGQFADLAGKALGPAVGAALKAPGVGTALGKLATPVITAAAAALGGPALAPVIAKLAPTVIGALAGAASTAVASQAGATGTGAALSEKEREFKLMEIQRLQNHQNEMFRLVSGMIRANHETRLGVIGNIR